MIPKQKCEQCGKVIRPKNRVRRRRFCSLQCSGKSRRIPRTKAERVERKRLYDIEYRERLGESRKAAKRAYYQANREKILAKWREQYPQKKRYMRRYLKTYWTPEKKAEKTEYDKWFRAKKYGEYAECQYLTVLLNKEVKSRLSNYEIRLKNGTLNKALLRGRNGQVKRGYT